MRTIKFKRKDGTVSYLSGAYLYTGMIDPSGSEIYEGDTVEYSYDDRKSEGVVFMDGSWAVDHEPHKKLLAWAVKQENFIVLDQAWVKEKIETIDQVDARGKGGTVINDDSDARSRISQSTNRLRASMNDSMGLIERHNDDLGQKTDFTQIIVIAVAQAVAEELECRNPLATSVPMLKRESTGRIDSYGDEIYSGDVIEYRVPYNRRGGIIRREAIVQMKEGRWWLVGIEGHEDGGELDLLLSLDGRCVRILKYRR